MTAEMVRNDYQGIGTDYEMLLRALDKHNADFAKRVGKDRSLNTYQKISHCPQIRCRVHKEAIQAE